MAPTLDRFVTSPLTIKAEVLLRIEHCLLAKRRRRRRSAPHRLAPAVARAVPPLAGAALPRRAAVEERRATPRRRRWRRRDAGASPRSPARVAAERYGLQRGRGEHPGPAEQRARASWCSAATARPSRAATTRPRILLRGAARGRRAASRCWSRSPTAHQPAAPSSRGRSRGAPGSTCSSSICAGHVDEPRVARGAATRSSAAALSRQGAGLVPGRRWPEGEANDTSTSRRTWCRPWIRSLEPYPPGKPIEELEREYGITGSIKLASNENPLGPSPKAVRGAARGARATCTATRTAAASTCAAPLARKLGVVARRAHLRQRLERDHRAGRAHLPARRRRSGDGRSGVRHLPHGRRRRRAAPAASCRCATTPTTSRRSPTAITPATRLVFLANPNNPTGTIFFRARVGGASSRACRAHVIVVMDEAYVEFVEDPAYPDSLADLRRRAAR